MRTQLHAEILKLRSVRTTWLFVGVTMAVTLLAVIAQALTAGGDLPPVSDPETQEMLFTSATGLAPVAAVLLGTLGLSSEVRHHTLASTLLIEPRREVVLVAKAVATAAAGGLLGLVAAVTAIASSWLVLVATSTPLVIDTDPVLAATGGTVVAAALAALLGLGIGGVARNQAAAIGVALVLLLAVEPLVGAFLPSVATWLPSAVAARIASAAPDAVPSLSAAVALYAGYVLVVLAAAGIVLRRVDV